ncbi:MAG TPA: YidC/Oxa1 family insertase periplasmic-domain containing protein, partial [Phycisphaerae bacterium]|nr:YidC/Oxa1 family insertase periplasmic-domain containing protein [Phycisphaerae bacterium]
VEAAAPVLQAVGAEGAVPPPIVLGSTASDSRFDLEVELTPRGAAVERLALARSTGFFQTVEDRRKPADEREPMELVSRGGAFSAFTIPELRVRLKGADAWSKVDLSQVVWKVEAAETGPTRGLAARRAQAVFSTAVQDESGKTVLEVRKTFVLAESPRSKPAAAGAAPYQLRMSVSLVPVGDRVEKVAYAIQGPPALPLEARMGMSRGGAGDSAVAGAWSKGYVEVSQVTGQGLKKAKEAAPETEVTQSLAGPAVAWVGEVGKYFAVVMIPQEPSPEGTFAAGAEAFRYSPPADGPATDGRAAPAAGVRLLSKELSVAPGEPLTHEVVIFAGPKEAGVLETYYATLGLQKLIVWATPCCFVSIPGLEHVSRGLVWLLEFFYGLLRNYGLAIILLVLLLRVMLHPVTRWSTKSMAEMQKLAPKMQQIREEFAHDKQRMQEELAKIGGLKSMSGCLPMLIQLPIWIALYSALGAAIQLRHAAVLPASWLPAGSIFLQDLAAPDALVHWTEPFFFPGREIPLLGWLIGGIQGMMGGGLTSFNLLPILMGAVMYLQQRITPTPATGPQAEQQKKMMVFMTLFFAVVLYGAPSGLCLYILTSTFLGFFEQRYLRKKMAPRAEGDLERGGGPAPAVRAPAGEVRQKPLVAGREKSLAERAESWLQKHIAPPKDGTEEKGGKKRK